MIGRYLRLSPDRLQARSRAWYGDLSLRTKITLPFLALILVLTLVGAPLAVGFVSDQMEQQELHDLISRMGSVEAYLDERSSDLHSDVEALATSDEIRATLSRGDTAAGSLLLTEEMKPHHTDFAFLIDTTAGDPTLVASVPQFDSIAAITGTDGDNRAIGALADGGASVTHIVDLSEALGPRPEAVTEAAVTADPGVPGGPLLGLAAAAPVRTFDGRRGYVVIGDLLDLEFMADLAAAAGGAHKIDGQTVPRHIVSLYRLQPDGLGQVMATSAPDLLACASGALLPTSESGGSRGSDGTATTAALGGEGFLVTDRALRMGGFPQGFVSLMAPTDELASAQSRVRLGLLAGAAMILALVVLIGYQVSRTITRPLVQLSTAAREAVAGRLDVTLPRARGDEIGELARSLSAMTSTMQENTRTIQSRLEEISLLYAFSSAASSTLDLHEILQTLLHSTARVVAADSGSVMMVSSTRTELHLMANLERSRIEVMDKRVAITEGIAGWVVRNRRPLVLPRDFADHPELLQFARGQTTRSVSLPIDGTDACLGVLNLNSSAADDEFTNQAIELTIVLANQAAAAIENAQLFETLRDLHTRVVRALGEAIDAKDGYTQGHSALVAKYGAILAADLGLTDHAARDFEIAGYLHDIGKIGIRDEILNKEGRLTPEEFGVVRTHPVMGANIIEPIGFSWEIVAAIRHHHEWWNGNGYPDGLRGRQIPLWARILAIVDAFEAMTAVRPYKQAMNFEEAWLEISRMAGVQFDPDIVEHFLAILDTLAATQQLADIRRP